ncbi:MAG: flagellar hook-basal body complex protein FliE, partial [Euryarchaeota archaeon]|nr:flagellar hook-basal body complex protein FliE [Euryarchaeota archaeon]
MKVLVLTGMPGAGKEEFVSVAKGLGFDIIRMGDVVRKEASSRNLGTDDQNVGGFAHSERQRLGYDIWAKRTVPLVKRERTLIDGCRGDSELAVFREAFGEGVRVVAIHASARTRFDRLRSRNRADAPVDFEQFRERDRRELGWGLGNLVALANHMIVNEGTLEEFKRN